MPATPPLDAEADPFADPDEQLPEATELPEATLGEDLRELIDQGKVLAEAELAWQKSRAAFAGSQAGGIALLAALAMALAFFALMALTFGLVLALAPLLTAWGAMGAVAGGLLLAALFCGAAASLRVRRVVRLISDRKPEP